MQFGLFKETNLIDNANHRGRNRYTPATVVRRWQLFKLSAAVAGFAWREVPPAQGGLSRQLLLDSLGESGPLRQMRLARERLTSRAGSRGQRGGYPLAKRCWQHLARAIPLRGGVALTKGWGTLDAHVGPCFQQGPTGLNVSSMSCDLIQVASQSIISNKLNNSITAVRLNALSGPAALAGPHWAQ